MTEILSRVPLPNLYVPDGQKSIVVDRNGSSDINDGDVMYRIEQISDYDRSKSQLTPRSSPQKSLLNNDNNSKKVCEAFLMTGDKIIRLTPKISPNFAKIKQQELTEHVQICNDLPLVTRQSSYDVEENFMTDKKVKTKKPISSKLERNLSAETPFCDAKNEENFPRPDTPIYCSAPASPNTTLTAATSSKNFNFPSASSFRDGNDDVFTRTKKSDDSLMNFEPKNCGEIVVDAKAAEILAKRLYNLEGFGKTDVADHISKNTPFSKAVLEAYVNNFDFDGSKLDEALRKFLFKFCLTGETHKRERIISRFAERYFSCNVNVFRSSDEIHVLSCALLLLNVDLHNDNIKKRMKFADFAKNVANSGYKFPKPLLKSLFCSIQNRPLRDAFDRNFNSTSTEFQFVPKLKHIIDLDVRVTISGWLFKKSVFEEKGKPTPFGRRYWRNYYVTLRASTLYLQKDDRCFRQCSYISPQNFIPIFHAFAREAKDYTKKMNVIRLQTSTHAEYLLQCPSYNEMQNWTNEINFAAAVFSAPCLPAPVGSQRSRSGWSSGNSMMINTSLSRHYSLPKYRTKYNYDQQLTAYGNRLGELRAELKTYHRNLPNRTTATGKILKFYAENEIFILNEIERYECYVDLLEKRSAVARDIFKRLNGANSSLNYQRTFQPVASHCLNDVIMETSLENSDLSCSKSQNHPPIIDYEQKSGQSEFKDDNSRAVNRRSSYDSAVGHSYHLDIN
uniref:Uncharacterized protein n=1 Tax=Romanomermis culicivorax TaxID=13658 RepID=A0A915HX68_ROMCU